MTASNPDEQEYDDGREAKPNQEGGPCARCGLAPGYYKTWRYADSAREASYEHVGPEVRRPRDGRIDIWVCSECDGDLMNGGAMLEAPEDIYQRRLEQAYENDPINEPLPPGWQR